MLQKETTPISFEEEYKRIDYTLRALNDTFLFMAY